MNYIKKVFKLAVAFVTLLVTLTVPNPVHASSNPVAKLNIDVKSRTEIVATVVVPANYDTAGFKVELGYDETDVKLEKSSFIKNIKAFDPDGEEVSVNVTTNTKKTGKAIINVAAIYPLEKKESYTLMTITFSLNDGKQLSDNSIRINNWAIASVDGTTSISSNKTDKEEVKLECKHSATTSKVVKKASCSEKGKE